jgi:glycosyltransferase involved in cell wall biosynthesis
MEVGIDITPIIYNRGVSRYTTNLVRALTQEKTIKLSLFGSSWRQEKELVRFAEQLRLPHHIQKLPPTAQEILWNTLHISPIKKSLPNIEVFHSWDWLQPPDKDLPLVSTIHDLAILKFPETAHPKILKMHQQSWKILKERNAQIIAVSHATRKDVIELLGFSPHQVHVVYESLPQETALISHAMTEEENEHIKNALHLDQPYILFVGTREPRKNIERLIQAWEPLAKDVQLIIAGAMGWDDTSKMKITHPQQLRFLGQVSDKQLAVLYGEAELLAYPSLYEGFGLPILEAFYHGTSVVTSNISSMPEVAGNAAELVDPLSVESIRSGIKKVLEESKEDQQTRLQKMIIRRQLFSWQKTAEETIRVYQRAIEQAA